MARVILPSAEPLHETFESVKIGKISAGSVRVIEVETTQPLASVTSTLYVSALKPTAVCVFCPLKSDHKKV